MLVLSASDSLSSFSYNGHEPEQSSSCLIHHVDKHVAASSHVCSPCLIDVGGIGTSSLSYNGHEFEQSSSSLIYHADKHVAALSHVCSPCLIEVGGIDKLSSITPPTHNQNA